MTAKTPLLTLALSLASLAFCASPALAETTAPQWTISVASAPTNINPAAMPGEDHYTVLLTNTGDASSSGPVTITDVLPAGLSLDSAGVSFENTLAKYQGIPPQAGFSCALAACTYTPAVVPDQTLVLTFPLDVSSGPFSSTCEVPAEAAGCLTNLLRVSGGGGDAASQSVPTVISAHPAPFGIPLGAATTALSSLQAGAHPDITNTYAFATVHAHGNPVSETKDVVYRLPPGFASDFAQTPECSISQFLAVECPIDSQVGVTTVDLLVSGGNRYEVEAVYNLAPDPGHLAALGFSVGHEFDIQGEISLQPRRNAAEVVFANLNDTILAITGGSLTVWGVPADPIHDPLRYSNLAGGGFGHPSEASPTPYFTNPTSCGTAPLQSEFSIDSWQQPGTYAAVQMPYGPLVGCDSLTIEPQVEVQPSSDSTETSTGLNVVFHIPQHYENAYGVVASNLDDVKVVLPEGMTLNPSAGAGLVSCSEAQFAYEGGVLEPEPGQGCPRESKLGSVHVISPGVSEEAIGSLFLAESASRGEAGKNPFGSLVAVYLVARIHNRGVIVTAAGKVEPNLETGQLTTTFDENPQLPFGQLTFTFHQGATSPLVTPPTCGDFTSETDLTPWSEPLQEHLLSAAFEITSGIGGGSCPSGGTPPFAPQVISGTASNDAGAYSPFLLRIVREDGEQELTKFTSVFPPGLTGNLSGIPFCSEADIEASRMVTGTEELEHPSCSQASEIGHTIVEAGVGKTLAQAPGKLYLGGPYHGSALSVVSITAAKVGPFDLGTVVIRFALSINPITAQVEINGANSDPIPHIIDGIIVHVRDIRAYISREKFILNPTSCEPMSISEAVTGAGADPANPADQMTVGASARFQTADCSSLAFKPGFAVTTQAKTSGSEGASLTAKLTYPSASLGTQSNIKSVRVELPKQMPSRLTTLQKACTSKVFDANPAGCPGPSLIGHATAITPILPEPLSGPAYFVSNGTAKFPELIIVLQGYGFTIDLHGETFISKTGVTSTTFAAVPDEPIGFFELSLPQGPYSALTAVGSLCKTNLLMPTTFTAQNGITIRQTTKIDVTGCPKAKKATHKKHKKDKKGKKGKGKGKGKKKKK